MNYYVIKKKRAALIAALFFCVSFASLVYSASFVNSQPPF
jgi:hypothetical protein